VKFWNASRALTMPTYGTVGYLKVNTSSDQTVGKIWSL